MGSSAGPSESALPAEGASVSSRSADVVPSVETRSGISATLLDYVSLTKPRVIVLLLITTVPAMIVADGGWPSAFLMAATLLGGTLSAGGANAINCWFDRDIDKLMSRTSTRPTATGAIRPSYALGFGVALGSLAFVVLWWATTPLAALLSLAALLFYVFIYTIWLKRRTDQNIVVGGAAGAFPPLVGWAAVTGELSFVAAAMFMIIFLWTPPHFWALSLRLEADYGRAKVPMLPVTRGPAETRKNVVGYSLVLVAATLAIVPFTPLGWLYASAAAVLGLGFLYGALRLWQDPARPSIGLYKYSLLYLALLFVAMASDTLVIG